MSSRGVSIAIGIIAVSLAFGTFVSLGIADDAGVGLSPGLEDERGKAVGDATDPSATKSGSGDSFVGLATGGIQTLNTMRVLVTNTSQALQNLGAPAPVANAIETILRMAMAMSILYAIVRVKL